MSKKIYRMLSGLAAIGDNKIFAENRKFSFTIAGQQVNAECFHIEGTPEEIVCKIASNAAFLLAASENGGVPTSGEKEIKKFKKRVETIYNKAFKL